MTRHTLPGLQPQPLATYLAGLGLTRLLGEQPDPTATAAWTGSGLAVDTIVDDIATWLVDDYVPTPVLSPWNGGSGFGQKGKAQREALAALLALPGPRLDSFRQAMTVATGLHCGDQYVCYGPRGYPVFPVFTTGLHCGGHPAGVGPKTDHRLPGLHDRAPLRPASSTSPGGVE